MENKIINSGDWIFVGKNGIPAVVCTIYDDNSNRIEIVYLDNKKKAINEDVIRINGKWEFVIDGPNGGYADNISRLAQFVSILRADLWWQK